MNKALRSGLARALWGALAALLCAGPAGALTSQEHIALSRSILKVEVQRQQGGYSLGSGVVVAADAVLTNCHVTRDALQIHVIKLGLRLAVQAQAVDIEHDLCLLRVPGVLATEALTLGRSLALIEGQPVVALGYVGGAGLNVSDGQVVGLHAHDEGRVIQSSNFFNSGASGGALIDAQMRLVGILTFRMRGGEAHYFSSPIEWLARLQNAARFEPVAPQVRTRLPYWGAEDADQPRYLRAQNLQRGSRWAELRSLARQWREAGDGGAAPHLWLGLATQALDEPEEALSAFESAVSLEPQWAAAWLRLGLLAARLGQSARAQAAWENLQNLSPALAAQLLPHLARPAPPTRPQ